MSYTKRNWDCGDKITADALNHMEQGIYDAQDKGYECTETFETLFDDDVTTVSGGSYSDAEINPTEFINTDHVRVTIDGTEYECDKREDGGGGIQYGAPYDAGNDAFDFSEYPFGILSDSSECYFNTQTAGTYAIKIESVESNIDTSECFEKAVKSVATYPLCIKYDHSISPNYIYNKTWAEFEDAYNADRMIFVKDHDGNVGYLSGKNSSTREAYFMYYSANEVKIKELMLRANSDTGYLYYENLT